MAGAGCRDRAASCGMRARRVVPCLQGREHAVRVAVGMQ